MAYIQNNSPFLKQKGGGTTKTCLPASKIRSMSKEQREKFKALEKLIIPLLIKLAKSPEAYIHWPNRAEVIEAQLKKIVAITRGK